MLICGSPMGSAIPLRMPKSAGFNWALARLELERRFNPKRNSLMRLRPNVCVSFSEKNCRLATKKLPKPGTVLPLPFGSLVSV